METIGRIVFIPRGNYDSSATYNRLDWVRSGGKAWVCKLDNTTNIYPVEGDNWTILVQDGSSEVTWEILSGKPFEDIDNDTLKVNPITRELYVDSTAASALSELTDVTISSPQDKQVLTWDDTTEKWINKAGSSADLTLTAAEWEAYTDEQKATLEDETIINITDDYLPDMVMTTAEWEERKDDIGDGIMVTITDDEDDPTYVSSDFDTTNGVLALSDEVKVNIEKTENVQNDSDEFDISLSYSVGDLCIYNNKLYKFTDAKTAGAWNPNVVEQVSLVTVSNSLNGDIDDINDDIDTLNEALINLATSTQLNNINGNASSYVQQSYNTGDYVIYNDNLWVAKQATADVPGETSSWELVNLATLKSSLTKLNLIGTQVNSVNINSSSQVSNNTTTNVDNITLTEGKWILVANADFSSNANGDRELLVGVTASARRMMFETTKGVSIDETCCSKTIIYNATGTITLNLFVRQTSGATLTVYPAMQAVRIA